jgi:Ca-activated chloride channel family protein
MHFAAPLYFLSILFIFPCLWFARRQRKALGHSQVSALQGINAVPIVGRLPSICRLLFVSLVVAALSQPQIIHKIVHTTIQTRDFLVTVDVSGSMDSALVDTDQQKFAAPSASTTPQPGAAPTAEVGSSPVPASQPATATPPKPPTRAEAAREGVRQFLLRRKDDRVGLITFDDRCYYNEPIGKPEAVAKKLDAILYKGGGTNFDGPSPSASEPGAIACSVEHFADMHATKQRVLIMVTDGEDAIDEDRAAVLAQAIHDQNIKMFVLGVGEGWSKSEKSDLQKFVERSDVRGSVIRVGDAKQMRDAFAQIDRLEKSNAEIDVQEDAQDLYPYFVIAAFLVLLIWISASAFVREPL